MSPLVWDLGHIAAYEDLWLVHRSRRRAAAAARARRRCTTPSRRRAPCAGGSRCSCARRRCDYLRETRDRTLDAIERARHRRRHACTRWSSSTSTSTTRRCCRRSRLARLAGVGPRGAAPPGAAAIRAAPVHTGLETVEVPAGPFDARRTRDALLLRQRAAAPPGATCRAFRIGRTPVTNATWLTFAEGGGYERREWWSDEGWAWKEEYDIERPGGWGTGPPPAGRRDTDDATLRWRGEPVYEWRCGAWEPLHPDRPVVHVSWFEADAFARAHGVRLPTEAEWEKAATWDQDTGDTHDWPWGDEPPAAAPRQPVRERDLRDRPGRLASGGSRAVRRARDDRRRVGVDGERLQRLPRLPRPPVPASTPQVFFGDGLPRPCVEARGRRAVACATPTFRNWDLPIRRQIFAGVRIARDAT